MIKALQVRKQIILESNIDDWEYTNKLAEFERLFLHIEKTKSESLEAFRSRKNETTRESGAEEERVRLNEEKVRIKKIKAEESAQGEKAKADREAAKEKRRGKNSRSKVPNRRRRLERRINRRIEREGHRVISIAAAVTKTGAGGEWASVSGRRRVGGISGHF